MGMNGVLGASNMQQNCGMEGMHGGNQTKKPENLQVDKDEKIEKVSDGIRGQKIDLEV